jgi:hypothetical protein
MSPYNCALSLSLLTPPHQSRKAFNPETKPICLFPSSVNNKHWQLSSLCHIYLPSGDQDARYAVDKSECSAVMGASNFENPSEVILLWFFHGWQSFEQDVLHGPGAEYSAVLVHY